MWLHFNNLYRLSVNIYRLKKCICKPLTFNKSNNYIFIYRLYTLFYIKYIRHIVKHTHALYVFFLLPRIYSLEK
jgi:hypothetical protein